MLKDHKLFIASTVLIAVTTLDFTIQSGGSIVFNVGLFVLPVAITAILWTKMKDTLRMSLAFIFFLLELNYLASETIPSFVNDGVTAQTRNGLLLIPAVVLLLVVTWIVALRVYKEKNEVE